MNNPVFRFKFLRGPAGHNRDYAKVPVTVLASTEADALSKARRLSNDPSGREYRFWVLGADEVPE